MKQKVQIKDGILTILYPREKRILVSQIASFGCNLIIPWKYVHSFGILFLVIILFGSGLQEGVILFWANIIIHLIAFFVNRKHIIYFSLINGERIEIKQKYFSEQRYRGFI